MITLPSNVQWVTDDLAVAVVAGDHKGTQAVPGPQFVAPQEWVQYDKPCETCGGKGVKVDPDSVGRAFFAVVDRGHGAGVEHLRCPDCDGWCRHVWDVRWPCGNCAGIGGYHGELSARATLQVVPVVEYDRWSIEFMASGESQPDCVVVHGGVVILVGPDGRGQRMIPLDPLPQPGRDWVLVVRRVS